MSKVLFHKFSITSEKFYRASTPYQRILLKTAGQLALWTTIPISLLKYIELIGWECKQCIINICTRTYVLVLNIDAVVASNYKDATVVDKETSKKLSDISVILSLFFFQDG